MAMSQVPRVSLFPAKLPGCLVVLLVLPWLLVAITAVVEHPTATSMSMPRWLALQVIMLALRVVASMELLRLQVRNSLRAQRVWKALSVLVALLGRLAVAALQLVRVVASVVLQWQAL